jgi:hypothetical protein
MMLYVCIAVGGFLVGWVGRGIREESLDSYVSDEDDEYYEDDSYDSRYN